MSQNPRSIPVGIFVSVSGPPRRPKYRTLADIPSIKRKDNLPVRLGIVAGCGMLAIGLAGGLNIFATYGHAEPAAVLAPIMAKPIAQQPMMVNPPNHGIAVAAKNETPRATLPPHTAARPIEARNATLPDRSAIGERAAPQALPPACSNLGAAVSFLDHPPDAFPQAARSNKLVLMVHLSGNFEDQVFT
jgi:hypothetical protein